MAIAPSSPVFPACPPARHALAPYGWHPSWEAAFTSLGRPQACPARVSSVARTRLTLTDGLRELHAPIPLGSACPTDAPQAGDWVATEPPDASGACRILAVLPRSSCILRRAAGKVPADQVIACNVDTALVVMGLDGDYNLRRLERYRVLLAGSNARMVVVLNKADLAEDLPGAMAGAAAVSGGAQVIACSAATLQGVDALRALCLPGTTLAPIGSSGVGKSTLINALLGDARQQTGAVRAGDDRGRHTTTARTLIPHPDGWCILDTPGMRELRLHVEDAQVIDAFADVEALAGACHFRDCTHTGEPGCAIRTAIDAGTLCAARAAHYHQLLREAQHTRLRMARPPRQQRREPRRPGNRRAGQLDEE